MPVVVAFDAGNLATVARAYIGEPKIVAGDNDRAGAAENQTPESSQRLPRLKPAMASPCCPSLRPMKSGQTGTIYSGPRPDDAHVQFRRAPQLAQRAHDAGGRQTRA